MLQQPYLFSILLPTLLAGQQSRREGLQIYRMIKEMKKYMKLMSGVKTSMIEVRLPKLFPTMSIHDKLKVEQWYVQERDVIQPNSPLIEVDAPPGLISIPTPPTVT